MLPQHTKTTARCASATALAIPRAGQEHVQQETDDRDDQGTQHCGPESVDLPAESEHAAEPRGEQQQQAVDDQQERSEEHTSELQSLMRISYAVFCWKKK